MSAIVATGYTSVKFSNAEFEINLIPMPNVFGRCLTIGIEVIFEWRKRENKLYIKHFDKSQQTYKPFE